VLDLQTGEIVWESQQFATKTVIPVDSVKDYFKYYSASDTTGYIEALTNFASDGRKYRLEVSIHNLMSTHFSIVNGERRGRYAIGASIYPRKDVSTDIDAWVCNSGSGFSIYNGQVKTIDGNYISNFYTPATDSCSIGSYAVSDSTISVGAFAARNSYYSMTQNRIITDNSVTVGDIASFSSYQIAGAGPTGEALPTVCAPGINVVAAGSRYSYFARNSAYTVLKDEDGYYWGVMSGTSMAAPTVAGIIALWLEANPNLSVADIKRIIAQTAIKDRFTMAKPDRFGPNGKIDAMAGMKLVLQRMGYKMGDVNNDGLVDVYDVVLMINYILTGYVDGFIYEMADLSNDGLVDVADVSLLIDKVLVTA
jgi:subtilisin family serine protease